jgi:hypothetical protein
VGGCVVELVRAAGLLEDDGFHGWGDGACHSSGLEGGCGGMEAW